MGTAILFGSFVGKIQSFVTERLWFEFCCSQVTSIWKLLDGCCFLGFFEWSVLCLIWICGIGLSFVRFGIVESACPLYGLAIALAIQLLSQHTQHNSQKQHCCCCWSHWRE